MSTIPFDTGAARTLTSRVADLTAQATYPYPPDERRFRDDSGATTRALERVVIEAPRVVAALLDACTEVERLRTSLAEAEHNVRALRAECARLGAAACDAKWDLMP